MTQLDTRTVPDAAVVRRPARVRLLWLLVAVALLLAFMTASVALGSRTVGWADILAAFGGADETMEQAAVTKRIPRTLLAVCVGAALGLAGAVMQGVTRNPLGDPSILGVSMGASLAVVTAMVTVGLSTATGYIWAAILGAAIAAVFVYAVGSLGRGGATPLKLALAGAATSAAFTSLISALVLPRNDIAGGFRSWQIGGVGGATYDSIRQVLPFLGVGPGDLPPLRPGPELPRPRRRSRGRARRAGRDWSGASPGSVPCCSAAPPPRSPGPSALSAWSSRTSAACWSGSTTGGCCPSPRSSARRC